MKHTTTVSVWHELCVYRSNCIAKQCPECRAIAMHTFGIRCNVHAIFSFSRCSVRCSACRLFLLFTHSQVPMPALIHFYFNNGFLVVRKEAGTCAHAHTENRLFDSLLRCDENEFYGYFIAEQKFVIASYEATPKSYCIQYIKSNSIMGIAAADTIRSFRFLRAFGVCVCVLAQPIAIR